MFRKVLIPLNFIALLILCAASVFGQVTGGRVRGVVSDSTGAVLPNATVNLQHKDTAHTLTTQTNETGAYYFPNVPVGDYSITVTGKNFQPAVRELTVVLNQESTLDVSLLVGSVTENVEVTAASEALVQTDSSQLGRSFSGRQVLDLPISGDQNTLALLSPHVVGQSAGVPGVGGTVGGTRPRGNSFNIDGVDNNDPTITGPSTKVIQDAVQEFTLLNNNFNAEFGTGSGGQFNTITRSGTNEFHGSGFLYFKNQSLTAASSLEREQLQSGQLAEKPHFKDSRYGGTFGGPLVNNKLFFFGAVQREYQDQQTVPAKYSAPTALGLEAIAALPGASPYIVNLLRNNLALAPIASRTATVLGVPGIPFGDVVLGIPSASSETLSQINVDHLPNAKDQLRYRFSLERTRAEQAGIGNQKFDNLAAYDTRLFSATWIHTFGPSMVNDLRLAYRRVTENYPLKDSSLNSFPNLSVPSFNLSFGPNMVLPQGSPVDNNYQVYDAVTYVRGQHNFKFGGEFRRLIFTTNFVQLARGYYEYDDLDQLLRDQVPGSQNIRGVSNRPFTGNQSKFYGFGQDDWKLTPRLTLNLGLRYEYTTLPRDLATQELNALASVPGVIEFRRPKTDKNNFAPRVGLAYSPDFERGIGRLLFGTRGQSSLRASFDVSYYEQFQNLTLTSLPPQFTQQLDIATSAVAFGFDPNRPFLQNGGIPNMLIPITTPQDARAATGSFIPDQVTPYSMSWTFSYQRELTPSMVLEVGYLGTRGRKLPVQLRLNAGVVNESNLVIPTFFAMPTAGQLSGLPTLGQIKALPGMNTRRLQSYGFSSPLTSYQFAGNSQYDGASVSLTRRFSRGLGMTAAYTWSKTIDDSTNELNTSVPNPRRPQDPFNLRNERGLSALDIPHRLAVSFNYALPFFNQSRSGLIKTVFGGLEVNGIFQAQSGQPITVLSGVDSNLNFDSVGDRTIVNLSGVPGTSSAVRAINAAGQFVPMRSSSTVAYVALDPNAQYIQAGPGTLADAGRNTLRTHGFNRTDASLIKNFRFADDRFNVQLGAEAYNLFNQRIRTITGLGSQTGVAATAFATAGNPSFNDYSLGNYGGREIQLRLKFIF